MDLLSLFWISLSATFMVGMYATFFPYCLGFLSGLGYLAHRDACMKSVFSCSIIQVAGILTCALSSTVWEDYYTKNYFLIWGFSAVIGLWGSIACIRNEKRPG